MFNRHHVAGLERLQHQLEVLTVVSLAVLPVVPQTFPPEDRLHLADWDCGPSTTTVVAGLALRLLGVPGGGLQCQRQVVGGGGGWLGSLLSEVGMFERLLGRAAPGRVPADHRVEEGDGPGPHPAAQDGGEVGRAELGELEAHLAGQLVALAPVGEGGGAQHAADLVDLVDLRTAGEQRPPGVELGHDAANRPDVNRTGKDDTHY